MHSIIHFCIFNNINTNMYFIFNYKNNSNGLIYLYKPIDIYIKINLQAKWGHASSFQIFRFIFDFKDF